MLHFFWCGYDLSENSYNQYEFSNFEIAKWAEYYLGSKTSFNQCSWLAGKVTENSNDILLGHPVWDGRSQAQKSTMGELLRDWVKDNAVLPTADCHPNTYILMPWVPEFPPEWTEKMPRYKRQLMAARKIFALCGEIWIERTLEKKDKSIQYQLKDKLVRCNMGVASQNFPIVKQKFNVIGERQILHISHLGSYKGFDITCKSLEGLDTILHVASQGIDAPVGLVEFPIDEQTYIFNFLGSIDNNDLEFNYWVVENCDFYIHTANMDAQGTTVLENCVRGLVPLVTPESGFSSPHAIYLTSDPTENRKIIEWALNLPESELLKRSQLIRNQVILEHNWEDIFERVWQGIMIDINNRVKENNSD